MDAKPASSYVSPFSNQEGGGFGFEYNSEGQMNFWIFASANWISAHAAIETGNWVHLVATFDGSVLILYENGVEVNRTDVSGTPALPNADHLSIGADSKGNNGSERYASCKIATANVYRITLSASDVADLYAAYAD